VITLPNAKEVADRIEEALDHINAHNRTNHLSTKDWFPAIATQIATRLPGLECYAKGSPEPCRGGEWLFDFCALLYDREAPRAGQFVAQAVAIGEVEWKREGIDHDFEKLLVADARVLFMVFEMASDEDAKTELDRLQGIVERRREYLHSIGIIGSPIFLLSCWKYASQGPFVHRQIQG
jgi:hypothetical protein